MTSNVLTRKERPVSLRFRDSDLSLIDRAASLRGRSRTEFMRDAAMREAEEIVLQSAIVQQTSDAFAQFAAAIEARPRQVSALVKLFATRAPWTAKAAKPKQKPA